MTHASNTTMTDTPPRPSPKITPLSAPYWEAAAQGRLLLQKCASCGKVRHYPRMLCNACYSNSIDWVQASGRGKVHSWTVCHHAFHPSFVAALPYTLVTVDLDEGVRALGRWRGTALSIGDAALAQFEQRSEGPELFFTAATGTP